MAGPTTEVLEKQKQIKAGVLRLFRIIKENANALANNPDQNKVLNQLNEINHELYALIMPLVTSHANRDKKEIIKKQKLELLHFLVQNIENETLGSDLFLLKNKLAEAEAAETCKPVILSNNNNNTSSSQWIKRKLEEVEVPTILKHSRKWAKLSEKEDPLAKSINSPFPIEEVSAPPLKITEIFWQDSQRTAIESEQHNVAEILASSENNSM